jgi:dienelactone hydrolase
LGRARGGYYTALSEADVLQAIEYVQQHWRIDPDRIHLKGGSMGGGGTLRLGSRYPQRFASGCPTCSYGVDLPMGNLLTFPLYAMHSADDWVVPVVTARGPLTRLRQLGGQVIFDETNGFGHAVWNYAEGNRRADQWESRQVRPDSRTIRRIDFTALDASATRAWWAEVVEWGPKPQPARFALIASADNTLHADLHNLSRLRLFLSEAPFNRTQALHISINAGVPFDAAPPLPDTLILAKNGGSWQIESPESLPFRLHTPGGPLLLYNGSPLLIVYGTTSDQHTVEAMRSAAVAASKSPNPEWAADGGEAGIDGVPHAQNLYGKLNVKADREVTPEDLQRCHLVLIGTAAQNSLAAKLAPRLPVRLAQGKITCEDGFEVDATNRVFGLVHFNPESPQRLLFWVGSQDSAAYSPSNPITVRSARTFIGADLVIMASTGNTLVAARSFDSRWHWSPDRAASPLLPSSLVTHTALATGIAEALRIAAGADFAVAVSGGRGEAPAFVPGITRLSDRTLFSYREPVAVLDVSGTELRDMNDRLETAPSNEASIRLQPSPSNLVADRQYRIAVSAQHAGRFASIARTASKTFRVTDLQSREALERFLH